MNEREKWMCPSCPKTFGSADAARQHEQAKHGKAAHRCSHAPDDMEPDYASGCEVCGAKPVVPMTGMCGPCTFGEADTIGGNW